MQETMHIGICLARPTVVWNVSRRYLSLQKSRSLLTAAAEMGAAVEGEGAMVVGVVEATEEAAVMVVEAMAVEAMAVGVMAPVETALGEIAPAEIAPAAIAPAVIVRAAIAPVLMLPQMLRLLLPMPPLPLRLTMLLRLQRLMICGYGGADYRSDGPD